VKQIKKRLTYSNVMSSIAVFLVLGGATAFAAGLAKNSVGSKQLKKNAVTTAKIKNNAVTTSKIKNGAVTGAKVNLGTLGTVPNAAHAGSADSAGNADTVDGQHVVKIFRTLTSGESGVTVASAGGFTFVADCFDANVNVRVFSPSGPGWVMQVAGAAGSPNEALIEEYESGVPGDTGDMYIDETAGGSDVTYGTVSFYGATSAGTSVSGVVGFDYDTFGDEPENTCIVAGHLAVG
jgi:hypothetical protein